jgi:predicted DNA-binding protein (UPF0251 family)
MPRPFKNRKISINPEVTYFKPQGVPMRFLETISLGRDELEAIQLADLEELYQEQAAEKMGVSRQTFGNIVKSARKKIADAIVSGKAIRIEGGPVIEFDTNAGTGRGRACEREMSDDQD